MFSTAPSLHPVECDPYRAKVVRHAKYVTFQMAEVAVPPEFFAAIRERIPARRRAAVVGAAGLTQTPIKRLVPVCPDGGKADTARKP